MNEYAKQHISIRMAKRPLFGMSDHLSVVETIARQIGPCHFKHPDSFALVQEATCEGLIRLAVSLMSAFAGYLAARSVLVTRVEVAA